MKKKLISIVTWLLEWVVFICIFIFMIGGIVIGVEIARRYNQYWLLSYASYVWLRMIIDIFDISIIDEISMHLANKYTYCTKLFYPILAIILFMFSKESVISFICFIIVVFIGRKTKKQINENKLKSMEVI